MKAKSSIRIIGGKWRSRKVSFLTKEFLRPTPDRVRETLFNWLMPYITDSVCLDLYAGTGVLGFEALSRGAKSVVAIEQDRENVDEISANAQMLATDAHEVIAADCINWLSRNRFAADFVFVDPPYKENLLASTFAALENNNWVKVGSFIYFELDTPFNENILPVTWKIWRESKAGKVLYFLARKEQ